MKVELIEVPSELIDVNRKLSEPSGVIVLFRCDWGAWEMAQQVLIAESNIPAMIAQIIKEHPKAREFRAIRVGA